MASQRDHGPQDPLAECVTGAECSPEASVLRRIRPFMRASRPARWRCRAGTSRRPRRAAPSPDTGCSATARPAPVRSTVRFAAGSTRTRFAGSPMASGRPCRSSTWPMAAGRTDIRSATSAQVIRPLSTMVCCTTDSAVSRPSMPMAAAAHSQSLSSCGCGAWSVATASMVPSASACAQRLDVRGGAQRRVDLVDRVVALHQVLGEDQVVRGDLGGHRVALGLGRADQLHRAGRGDVADVQPGLGVRGQQDVAGDDRLLGDRRPAGQAQDPGQLALVHLRALGQPGLLRVLRDDAVEGLHVLQRAPHQVRVGDALAVVGEDPHAGRGVGHRAELGQPLAGQAHGDRADREHVAVPGLAAQPPDLLDHAGGVGDRVGVGHGVHGGEAAEGGGPGAGVDGLGVLAARLAQVGVQVDQARQGDQAAGVDHHGPGDRAQGPGVGDDAVAQEEVLRVTAQDARVLDQVGGAHAAAPFGSVCGFCWFCWLLWPSSLPIADSLPLSSR